MDGSLSAPLFGKRKKLREDDMENRKKSRARVSFSCGECHRRKQKCDRNSPCSHCVSRKVPHLCQPYEPGSSGEAALHARLLRVEQIIEAALPEYSSKRRSKSPTSGYGGMRPRLRKSSLSSDDDDQSASEDRELAEEGSFQSGKWYGQSASGSVAPATFLEQIENAVAQSKHELDSSAERRTFDACRDSELVSSSVGSQDKNFSRHASPSTTPSVVAAIIDSVRHGSESSAAEMLKSLVQDCGVSPHKVTELLQELPPKRFSDVLIDFYFEAINWTRYPISEESFRQSYNSICANGVGANPNDARFLPLLFVVLAISARLAPEHIAGDDRTRRLTSLRYYWSSRRSVLIAEAVTPDSLDVVLTRLLVGHQLPISQLLIARKECKILDVCSPDLTLCPLPQTSSYRFDRRITDCWSQIGAAVRTALALGLHRDGASMGMDYRVTEYRRRIWAYLYHADRSYSLVLGRPAAIQDAYTSALLPLNVEELPPSRPLAVPPLSKPTRMTFVILRHRLASIIGRICHMFQLVHNPGHYSDLLALDHELLTFVENLPSHFALAPDKSLDDSMPFIPVHRHLLLTEIFFVRISMHRPHLLRKLGSDRYEPSRTACFESARKDYALRKVFRQSMPRDALDSLTNAYREFQTAMISGIYLILHPNGFHAVEMQEILESYASEREGLRELDETTKRELSIIEFLKSKSSCRGTSSPVASTPVAGSRTSNPHTNAELLLSLNRRKSAPVDTDAISSPVISPPRASNKSFSDNQLRFPPITTLHRSTNAQEVTSPLSVSSQSPEDDSAQSLLDHWCNNVNNGASMDSTDMSMGNFQWNTGSIMPGWIAPGSNLGEGGLEVADYNFWETLVNSIRSGPNLV